MSPRGAVPAWVSKVLGSILVLLLVAITVNAVLSQTLLSSAYLNNRLKQTNAYDKLSVAITDEITHNTTNMDPEVAAKVQSIVTPEVLEERLPGVLSQFEDYVKNGGTAPQIDVSDLVAQSEAAGIQVPADSKLNKPITLGEVGNYHFKPPSETAKLVHTLMIIAAVVVGLTLVLASWLRRDFRALAVVLTTYGAILGLIAALLWFVPDLFASRLQLVDANIFASVGQELTTTIAKDIATRFGSIAGISLLIGIPAWIILARLGRSKKQAPKSPRIAAV